MIYLSSVGLIAIGMFCLGMAVERQIKRRRRRIWFKDGKWKRFSEIGKPSTWIDRQFEHASPSPVRDAASQLRIVMSAPFSPQPLLNKSEARLFRELDRLVLALKPDWHVMAQVSLGEILRSSQTEAYACINSKRVDLLIVDEDCRPRHVIEYQGAGHHQ